MEGDWVGFLLLGGYEREDRGERAFLCVEDLKQRFASWSGSVVVPLR